MTDNRSDEVKRLERELAELKRDFAKLAEIVGETSQYTYDAMRAIALAKKHGEPT